MPLDSSLLFHFVRDALGPYSEDFRVIIKQNPTQFRLNGALYSAHVSYVHDSGNSRDNDDEVRIQIGRRLIEVQRARADRGDRIAFLGFFEGGKVFVAWDPRHIFSLQAREVVSVYARQSQLEGVENDQAAVHSFQARLLGETSFAIALPANALGLYLENIGHFHRLMSVNAIREVLQEAPSAMAISAVEASGSVDVAAGQVRERFTFERRMYPRDPRFTKVVLKAYERTCCICCRQLGLVQAAHIIPHSEPDCPNTVQNGLALCVEHHRLYDDALLLPGPGRRLIFNPNRAEYLRETGQGRGLDAIEELSRREYDVPGPAGFQPSNEYLQHGLDIRMGD